MMNMYVLAFILAIIVLCFVFVLAGRSEKKIALTLQKTIVCAILTAVANIILLLAKSEAVCLVAYGMFYSGIDWLLFFWLRFAAEYTGYVYKNRIMKCVVYGLLAADFVSLFANVWTRHAFECEQLTAPTNETYYHLVPYVGYYLHLLLPISFIVMTIGCLLVKTYSVPSLYRWKYIVIAILLAVMVVNDLVYVFLGGITSGSTFGFMVGAILSYYFAFVYEPRKLRDDTVVCVVSEMKDAVLVYDIEGNCLASNESADQFLGGGKGAYQAHNALFSRLCKEYDLLNYYYKATDYSIEKEGKELHFRAQFQKLNDKKNNYVGSFLIIHDRTEEENELRKQRYRASYDRLTGIYNRDYFFEQVEKCLKEHEKEEYVLICSDLKDFKIINDVFGAKAGDELLIKIAGGLKKSTLPGEIYGRLVNDRFALLMKKSDFKEDAIVETAREFVQLDSDANYPVYMHIGVYEIKDRELPVSVMCDRAYMAIGTIKDNYQVQIAYYDDKLRSDVLREQALTKELDWAIENGQFQIYIQPQITAGGKVLGGEALVRWIHPDEGMIYPGEFISIFEKNGMIVKLDQHIWELACKKLAEWKKAGREDMYISVNISPKDFYFLNIYKVFTDLVKKYEIKPQNLKLEITETVMMTQLEEQKKLIEKLQQAGFIIEMDDFGSGYSSLNMLKDINVDVLKIDMAFLGKTEDEARSRTILQSIIELSRGLDLPVITEGVETAEQVQFLTNIGCLMFQGYYFARPMEVQKFEEKYMLEKQEDKEEVIHKTETEEEIAEKKKN